MADVLNSLEVLFPIVIPIEIFSLAAEKVIKSGKPVKMDPMSPFDRRIVHLSLEKQPKITTESEGSGSRRQVVIKLK